MRPGGGKAKGSAYERRVCKDLSLWLSNGKRDDLLWRSAMSGGRATIGGGKGLKRAAQAGDISGVDDAGIRFTTEFYVECKHLRDLQIDKFVICGTGVLSDVWLDAARKAKRVDKFPIVIAKQNRLPTIACLLERSVFMCIENGRQPFRGPFVVDGVSIHLFDEMLECFWFNPLSKKITMLRGT